MTNPSELNQLLYDLIDLSNLNLTADDLPEIFAELDNNIYNFN